jgi:hypothetical protein
MKANLLFTWILTIIGIITVFISFENPKVLGITVMLFFAATLNYMDYHYLIRKED